MILLFGLYSDEYMYECKMPKRSLVLMLYAFA